MIENDLVMALEIVTEGPRARAPRDASRVLFAMESFRRETAKVEEKARSWALAEGVQGLGLGQKVTEGRATEELALRVYVDRKQPVAKLTNPVPKRVLLPELGEAETDVLEIGVLEREAFMGRTRPAMPGCGLGHPDVTVGTFGCLVRRKGGDPKLYILSNAHVLADEGAALVGDEILQAGVDDGGTAPDDVLAELADWVPFDFTATGFPNLVDAALARVRRKPSVTNVIRLLGYPPKGVGRVIRRGMEVMKVGRTTDYTTGVVQDVHFRFSLEYKKPGHASGFYGRPGHAEMGRVGFRDQVLCTRYTSGGDSGAAVLNKRRYLVGLHFAGSMSASVFNPVRHVFRSLAIELA
jgi:hypothetical protein